MGLSVIDDSIPVQSSPQKQELVALKESVRKIAMLLEASGVKEDEIIADFQKACRREMAT